MITVPQTIRMIIDTSLYWDENIDTAVEYTLSDYEDALSVTLHLVKALPIKYPEAVQNIEDIFLLLHLNDETIKEELIKHIALVKLGKIL